MASTRNRNMPNDYCIEQRDNRKTVRYTTYKYKRTARYNKLPEVGVNVGGMPNQVLAWNATDIESALYGIGESNLVKAKAATNPRLKKLDTVPFFDRLELYVPEPLVIENRPEIFRR